MKKIKIFILIYTLPLLSATPKPYYITRCTLQVSQLDNASSKLLFVREDLGEKCPANYMTGDKTLCDPANLAPGYCQHYEAGLVARKNIVKNNNQKHYNPDYSEDGTVPAERPTQVTAIEKGSLKNLELRERERNEFRIESVQDLAQNPPPHVEHVLTEVYRDTNSEDQQRLQNINENLAAQQLIASGTLNETVKVKENGDTVIVPEDTTHNKLCLCKANVQGLGDVTIRYGEKCPLTHKKQECFIIGQKPKVKGFTGVDQLCACKPPATTDPVFYVRGHNCPYNTTAGACYTVQYEDGLVVLSTPQ